MRASFKNLVKRFIAVFGRHRWPGNSSCLVILAYHRIIPKDDPRYSFEQPMMVVTPETLDKNLSWVAKDFNFISLNEWLTLCNKGTPPAGKHCAVTFDDGWIDNMEYALPVLQKHNVPATIYGVASMLDNKANYWPGRVTTLIFHASQNGTDIPLINLPEFHWLKHASKSTDRIDWHNLSTQDYSNLIESLKIYKDMEINDYVDSTRRALNLNYTDDRQVLSTDEIKSMLATGLIEIGSHTINHIRFDTDTDESILNDEIINSRRLLSGTLHTDIDTFCYPNGYHPENSVAIARKSYQGACTLEKGWNYPDSDFAKLKRISLHEHVANNYHHFNSRLSGWV